mgnify:CR=1 FL=1
MQPNGRPRLADVAERAGVSLKTASRALNGEYGVAPETAQRVQAAADALGFRPNRLAQSLAGGRHSALVGLVIPDIADPFVAEVAGGVEAVIAGHGLQLITASHANDPETQQRLVAALLEHRVAALILMPAPGPAGYLAPDVRHGLVVASLDRPLEGITVDTVVLDNEAATDEAIDRLVAAGHRRIGLLAHDPRLWTVARRIDAYRGSLTRVGIPGDPGLIVTDPDPGVARRAMVDFVGVAVGAWDDAPVRPVRGMVEAWGGNPGLFTQTAAQLVASEQARINGSETFKEITTGIYLQGDARLLNNRLLALAGVRFERIHTKAQGPLFEPGNAFVRTASGAFARNAAGSRIRQIGRAHV